MRPLEFTVGMLREKKDLRSFSGKQRCPSSLRADLLQRQLDSAKKAAAETAWKEAEAAREEADAARREAEAAREEAEAARKEVAARAPAEAEAVQRHAQLLREIEALQAERDGLRSRAEEQARVVEVLKSELVQNGKETEVLRDRMHQIEATNRAHVETSDLADLLRRKSGQLQRERDHVSRGVAEAEARMSNDALIRWKNAISVRV